jgi:hypothetical protein
MRCDPGHDDRVIARKHELSERFSRGLRRVRTARPCSDSLAGQPSQARALLFAHQHPAPRTAAETSPPPPPCRRAAFSRNTRESAKLLITSSSSLAFREKSSTAGDRLGRGGATESAARSHTGRMTATAVVTVDDQASVYAFSATPYRQE